VQCSRSLLAAPRPLNTFPSSTARRWLGSTAPACPWPRRWSYVTASRDITASKNLLPPTGGGREPQASCLPSRLQQLQHPAQPPLGVGCVSLCVGCVSPPEGPCTLQSAGLGSKWYRSILLFHQSLAHTLGSPSILGILADLGYCRSSADKVGAEFCQTLQASVN
jgi:hypothetical protein